MLILLSMTHQERFEIALTRVKSGESMRTIVAGLFLNWRRYKKECSVYQRCSLTAARSEYLEANRQRTQKKAQAIQPRFSFNTNQSLQDAVNAHCKAKGITVTKFLNTATLHALRKEKG